MPLFLLFLFPQLCVQPLNLILYFVQFSKFLDISLSLVKKTWLHIPCYVFLSKYHKNSLGNIEISQNLFFLILMAYWAGFRIFQQNQENPNKIGVVGQSEITSVE